MVSRTASRSTRSRNAGRRRGRRWLVGLAVVVVLLVGLDFGARLVAQNVMAAQIEQQGLPRKPDVSIEGFPFLTQVVARDFRQVDISASNVPAGPVTITSLTATARGIRLNSYAFSSGTITSLSGTVVISFSSLANTMTAEVGPLGQLASSVGLDLTAAGPDEVIASLPLVGSATWRVTRLTGNRLNIHLVSSSGDLSPSLLSAIQNVSLQLPKLPLGLTIDSVYVGPAGVVGVVSGKDVPFSKS